jgi:hypothetical protein
MPRQTIEDYREFSAVISGELYNRFAALAPIHGAIKWYIETSLTEFCDLAEQEPGVTQLIREAVYSHFKNRVRRND